MDKKPYETKIDERARAIKHEEYCVRCGSVLCHDCGMAKSECDCVQEVKVAAI